MTTLRAGSVGNRTTVEARLAKQPAFSSVRLSRHFPLFSPLFFFFFFFFF